MYLFFTWKNQSYPKTTYTGRVYLTSNGSFWNYLNLTMSTCHACWIFVQAKVTTQQPHITVNLSTLVASLRNWSLQFCFVFSYVNILVWNLFQRQWNGHQNWQSQHTQTIKYVKLIMFIWKPTLAICRVTKTYRSASKWT